MIFPTVSRTPTYSSFCTCFKTLFGFFTLTCKGNKIMIGRRITTVTEDTRETTFLFQRLSMALQRGNAVSFQNTMITE